MSFLSGWILTTVLSLSFTGCLFLSRSWQKFTLTIWKEDHFLHYSNISEFDFTERLKHPLFLSAVALPWCGKRAPRIHWNIYAGLFLLQGDFASSSSYYISDATLWKFTQINNSLIEINSVKIDPCGLYHLMFKIYNIIRCIVCIMGRRVWFSGEQKKIRFHTIFKPISC